MKNIEKSWWREPGLTSVHALQLYKQKKSGSLCPSFTSAVQGWWNAVRRLAAGSIPLRQEICASVVKGRGKPRRQHHVIHRSNSRVITSKPLRWDTLNSQPCFPQNMNEMAREEAEFIHEHVNQLFLELRPTLSGWKGPVKKDRRSFQLIPRAPAWKKWHRARARHWILSIPYIRENPNLIESKFP